MTSTSLLRRHPDIKWKRIGDSGILLNLRSGEYFELDRQGMAIWNGLDGKTPVADLARELAMRYCAPPRRVKTDVDAFLKALKKRKLVVVATHRSS